MNPYLHHFRTRQAAMLRSPLNFILGSLSFGIFLAWYYESGRGEGGLFPFSVYWAEAPPASRSEWTDFGLDIVLSSAVIAAIATWVALRVRGAGLTGTQRRWTVVPCGTLPVSPRARAAAEFLAGIFSICVVIPLCVPAAILLYAPIENARFLVTNPRDASAYVGAFLFDMFGFVQALALIYPIGLGVAFGMGRNVAAMFGRITVLLSLAWLSHWYGLYEVVQGRALTVAVLLMTALALGPARDRAYARTWPAWPAKTPSLSRHSRPPRTLLARDAIRTYVQLAGMIGLAAGIIGGLLRVAVQPGRGWVWPVMAICLIAPVTAPMAYPVGMPPGALVARPLLNFYNGTLAGAWAALPVSRRDILCAYTAYCVIACTAIAGVMLIVLSLGYRASQYALTTYDIGRFGGFALLGGLSCAGLAVGDSLQRRRVILWNAIVFGWLPTFYVAHFLVVSKLDSFSRAYWRGYWHPQDWLFYLVLSLAVCATAFDLLRPPAFGTKAVRYLEDAAAGFSSLVRS